MTREQRLSDLGESIAEALNRHLFGDGPRLIATGETDGDLGVTSTGQTVAKGIFQSAPLLIPNAGGGPNAAKPYKVEIKLWASPKGIVKINYWFAPDPRKDPHNHPWEDFVAYVVKGGYQERRFKVEDEQIVTTDHTYAAGDLNVVGKEIFHNVVEVQPGTVTVMNCGAPTPGNAWGYLHLEEMLFKAANEMAQPDFFPLLKQLNPHLYPPQ